MKTKPVLESHNELSPELVKPEPARPAQANPEPSPADAKAQRKNELHITLLEHSGFAGYRHWGLNE